MAFLNLKKEKIPDELPELDIDELERNFPSLNKNINQKNNSNFDVQRQEKPIQQPPLSREAKEIEEGINKIKSNLEKRENNFSQPVQEKSPEEKNDDERFIYKGEGKREVENSYFAKLYKDINKEIEDIDELDDWYKKKFFAEDVVSDMKKYWTSQKNDLMIKEIGKNYKEGINRKIDELKVLEAEWQEIYLKLIQKEVEMRKEEDGLKKVLADFVDSCKDKANIKNE